MALSIVTRRTYGIRSFRAYLAVLGSYMRVNWRSALEYRTNFVFDALLSLLEVGMYLFYWRLFFSISKGIPGVTYEQMAALVAFNHVIYAGADTLMGSHIWQAVETVVKGQLDVFLVQPKSAVFQLFFSGAQPMRAIQIVVGTILYFIFVPFSPASVGLYVFGLVIGTAIFSSWVVIIHSLTFHLGNAVVVYKLLSVILHFAKKPANIFSFAIRFVLYTVIPAAYVGTVQAQQAFHPSLAWMLSLSALAIACPFLAAAAFRSGLRRYESGNLMGIRL
jgi:ABC-2 type transport system permease protein